MTAPVDAHLHVWDLSVNTYPWLGPQHGPLYTTYTAAQAEAELRSCGITQAVLVQAEDSLAETRYLLEVAEAHPYVRGVVGWVPLEDPAATERALAELAAHRRFVGVRHLVHDDPRAGFLDLPAVRDSLRLLAEAGYAFDVPDAWPRHLAQARRIAEDVPDLTVVIDHLAKPPRGGTDLPRWEAEMRRVAALGTTVAKVSGLRSPGQPYTAAALQPVWDLALEAFGPDRLMYGGDWPMTVPDGGYRATYEVLAELVGQLPAEDRAQVMGGTAQRVYRLTAADDVAADVDTPTSTTAGDRRGIVTES